MHWFVYTRFYPELADSLHCSDLLFREFCDEKLENVSQVVTCSDGSNCREVLHNFFVHKVFDCNV